MPATAATQEVLLGSDAHADIYDRKTYWLVAGRLCVRVGAAGRLLAANLYRSLHALRLRRRAVRDKVKALAAYGLGRTAEVWGRDLKAVSACERSVRRTFGLD